MPARKQTTTEQKYTSFVHMLHLFVYICIKKYFFYLFILSMASLFRCQKGNVVLVACWSLRRFRQQLEGKINNSIEVKFISESKVQQM